MKVQKQNDRLLITELDEEQKLILADCYNTDKWIKQLKLNDKQVKDLLLRLDKYIVYLDSLICDGFDYGVMQDIAMNMYDMLYIARRFLQ